MSRLKIIRTEEDYQNALARFEELFQAQPNTKEGDEAEVLAMLIEEYEDKHFVIESPDPLEAIQYRMEQQGLTRKDLAEILGYKSRVSDIFLKKRKLNLSMVRKLHEKLHIPLESLIKEY